MQADHANGLRRNGVSVRWGAVLCACIGLLAVSLGLAASQRAARPPVGASAGKRRDRGPSAPKAVRSTSLPAEKRAASALADPLPTSVSSSEPLSLLDQVGKLAAAVSPAQVAAWKAQLLPGHCSSAQAAALHLKLGEWELAQQEQPERALAHFRQVQHLVPRSDRLSGLAAYDTAIALFFEGDYAHSASAFRRLLASSTRLPGYDWRTCALWQRHAQARASYHARCARLGVPEPPRLDPLCAASALAVCLRECGLPYTRKTVLAKMHVTGRGSGL